ncbi:MAG TPA: hypothetical protein QF361_05450, partial [Gammaproteobacteria bacterium]|nr:hypothetical protein [Gammaproteobacteria bacterium]
MANDASDDGREGADRRHASDGAQEHRQRRGPLGRLRALSAAAWLAVGLSVLSLVLAGALLLLWLEPFDSGSSPSNSPDDGPPASQAQPGSADTR